MSNPLYLEIKTMTDFKILNLTEKEVGMLFERIMFNVMSKIICENLINEINLN